MIDTKKSPLLLDLQNDLQNKIQNSFLKRLEISSISVNEAPNDCAEISPMLKENKPLIVMPLLVYAWKNDTYKILDGTKRFFNFKHANTSHCQCQILPEPVVEENTVALRTLLNCHRQLSLFEQLSFIGWCISFIPQEEFFGSCQIVGIDRKKAGLLLSLHGFDAQTKSRVLSNEIHLENAESFHALPESDKTAFTGFFRSMQLSMQMQRDILEWSAEIAFTKSQSISDLLSDITLVEIKNSDNYTVPQKIQKIHELIFSQRFPAFYKTNTEWKHLMRKTLGQTHGVQMTPNPYFEKNKLEIKITLTKGEQAKPVFENLASIPSDTWTALICPIE